MAAAVCDSSNQDEDLTVEEMQKLQEKFAQEAFEFLLDNAHIWIEYPKDFMIRFTKPENGMLFTSDVAKAIITIAYLYRMEYRHRARYTINDAINLGLYEDCVKSYTFPKDKIYFYNFLAWIAFIFDLTMYCYKEGYDYIERGEQFIANYPELDYFHSRGGFYNLIKYSVYMGVIYDNIEPIIRHKLSEDEILVPFIKCLENVERRNRYSNNRWLLITPEMRYASLIRRKLSAKYDIVSSYNPRRVIPGYRIILKKSSTKSTQTVSPEALKTHFSQTPNFDQSVKDDLVKDLTSGMVKIIPEKCVSDSDVLASNVIMKKSPSKSCLKDTPKFSKELLSETTKFDSSRMDALVCHLTSRLDKTTISGECVSDSDVLASNVIIKTSPIKSCLKISPKSSKVLVFEAPNFDSDEKNDLVIDLPSIINKTISEGDADDPDFAASKITPSFLRDTDDFNSVFIIHKRFLNRRKTSQKDSKYKRGLKIYCPSMNNDVLAANLNRTLDENIDNRCYMEIGNGVYAIIPPGSSIDDEDTRVIVLDTSSEEEDYSCPKPLHEITDVIWSRYQEREATKSKSEKDGSETKCTIDPYEEQLRDCIRAKRIASKLKENYPGVTTKKKSEHLKIYEAVSFENTNQILDKGIATEISSKQRMLVTCESAEALSKESGTVVHPEQKPFVIAKCTGAIPKVKKTDIKRRPRKGHHTENRSGDSEDSDQNNNNKRSQSYINPRKSLNQTLNIFHLVC